MKLNLLVTMIGSMGVVVSVLSCAQLGNRSFTKNRSDPAAGEVAGSQTPSWSSEDMAFFLHGSMSTEFVPETVLWLPRVIGYKG